MAYGYGGFRGCGYGDFVGSPQVFCEYGVSIGIEIQFPRQPWKLII